MRRRFCRFILMTVLMFISALSFSGLIFAGEKKDIINANRIFDYNFHAVYDGTPKSPRIMVMWGWRWDTCLKEGVDYTVEYQKQTKPGRQYSYTVKGIGNYTGTYRATGYNGWTLWYQIRKADFSFPGYSATYEADSDQVGRYHWILNKKVPYDYNLGEMFKFMKITVLGKELKLDEDYTIESSHSDKKEASIRIYFKPPYFVHPYSYMDINNPNSQYYEYRKYYWEIHYDQSDDKKDISNLKLRQWVDHSYTGEEIRLSPSFYTDETSNIYGTISGSTTPTLSDLYDYKVEYRNNIYCSTPGKPAEFRVVALPSSRKIKGKTKWFKMCDIVPNNIQYKKYTLGNYDNIYDGKAKRPPVSVAWSISGEPLTEGRDFTLTYENNIKPGTGKVTIKGINNFTGEKTLEFDIVEVSVGLDRTSAKMLTASSDKLPGSKDNSIKLTATVSPETYADKAVSWMSSDTSIAKVDANGKVTGVKPGNVTITALNGTGAKASCRVKVMSRKEYKLKEGAQYTFNSRLDKGLSMDVMYQDYETNTNVSLYNTKKRAAQRLTAVKKVVNGRSCWMLVRTNSKVKNRAITENKSKNIIFAVKKDTNWQLFRIYRFNDGSVQFINRATNDAIQVAGGKAGVRVNIEGAAANLEESQRWYGVIN